MKLWPSSLFGRLALLLVGVLAIAVAATILLFRHDRAALLLRHFGDTKIVQLQGLRGVLEDLPPGERRSALAQLARHNGVRIRAADDREPSGFGSRGWVSGRRGAPDATQDQNPVGESARDSDNPSDPVSGPLAEFLPVLAQLESRFNAVLGPGIEMRVQPRAQNMWIRLPAGGEVYWIGFPLPRRPGGDSEPSRALISSLALVAALIVAAFLFARYLGRPLRELERAVTRVGRGEDVQTLPESGPSEIAAVSRGFNAMLKNLNQIERDRAVLLAGVSHDLRTPLARLRLGIEFADADPATRHGMVTDIEEMDRVIGQFLDFARGESEAATEVTDLNALVGSVAERYAADGRDVRFTAGRIEPRRVRPTAIKRLVTNLVDNALAYGAPPVELATIERNGSVVIEIADRGPGIAPADVDRLKQPFTRATDSRARSDGAAGAGLGLAIVDRIAALHGGRFEIVPRDGGGMIARVTLPA